MLANSGASLALAYKQVFPGQPVMKGGRMHSLVSESSFSLVCVMASSYGVRLFSSDWQHSSTCVSSICLRVGSYSQPCFS